MFRIHLRLIIVAKRLWSRITRTYRLMIIHEFDINVLWDDIIDISTIYQILSKRLSNVTRSFWIKDRTFYDDHEKWHGIRSSSWNVRVTSENRHSDNEYFIKLRSVMIDIVPVIPVKDLDWDFISDTSTSSEERSRHLLLLFVIKSQKSISLWQDSEDVSMLLDMSVWFNLKYSFDNREDLILVISWINQLHRFLMGRISNRFTKSRYRVIICFHWTLIKVWSFLQSMSENINSTRFQLDDDAWSFHHSDVGFNWYAFFFSSLSSELRYESSWNESSWNSISYHSRLSWDFMRIYIYIYIFWEWIQMKKTSENHQVKKISHDIF